MANYFIIGSDGKHYGPIAGEDLRRWISENRVNAQTRAQLDGAGDWRPIAEFPEFAGAFSTTGLPPLTPVASDGSRTSSLAITSLVLGILGAVSCGFTSLFGLILGIASLVKIQNSGGRLKGFGLALAGTIVSGIFLLMLPLFVAMLLPALSAAKQRAMEINSMNNEKQLALAIMVYSNEHTNHLPEATVWCDAIQNNVGSSKQVFKSPAGNPGSRCDYAFNAKLDGLDVAGIRHPAQTVMIFESDAGWNANGGAELFLLHSRYGRGSRQVFIVAFADGHVESVFPGRVGSLQWDPNQ